MPDFSGGYVNLAVALRKAGKIEEAVEAYRKAIELDKKEMNAYLNLANLLREEGRLQEALGVYRSALSFSPDEPKALCGVGVIFLSQGKTDEAIKYCRKAADARPDFAEAYYFLAEALAHVQILDRDALVKEVEWRVQVSPIMGAHDDLGHIVVQI